MSKLVMATNNANKLREAKEILSPLGIEVLSLADIDIDCDPDENGATFAENAEIKAEAVYNAIADKYGNNMAVFADDSGLCVDALGGRPGVHSARYAPKGQECARLLDELTGVPDEKRTARFVCSIVFLDKTGQTYEVKGTCEGMIGHEERGTNGFGYDPVFVVGNKTMAEMTSDEKNAVSHRGAAMNRLYRLLEGKVNE
ncbi:MAG: RdgB/HAM1 family non-canonical purine NTP pyrophosphatase [Ruminococcus sp.]|nr:RdgB/HAM1 family non-canonical purine NTP pyrophosphatase [Ruminococcus sp.]